MLRHGGAAFPASSFLILEVDPLLPFCSFRWHVKLIHGRDVLERTNIGIPLGIPYMHVASAMCVRRLLFGCITDITDSALATNRCETFADSCVSISQLKHRRKT